MESKRSGTTYGQCRCCLSNGYHRDITKEYYSNGVREVYYEIFLECFNLFLSSNVNMSGLICSLCVQRLREASKFKAMVVEAERHFLDTLGDNETVFINIPIENFIEDTELPIKTEDQVEVKKEQNNEDSDEDHEANVDLDDSCEPAKVTKNSHDDLVPGEAQLLARFTPGELRRLPTRRTLYDVYPGYVAHLDGLRDKVVTSKMVQKLLEESNSKKKLLKIFISEKAAQITNASTLLEFSNATPFKSKTRSGFPCFYCRSSFENIDKMREHIITHSKTEARKTLATYGAESLIVYVDITDLKCTVCNKDVRNLNELKSHLTKLHGKKMHLKFTDRVIPFKLSESNIHECQICGFKFETFGAIERHMNNHYRNYVCNECGTGFVTKYRLKVHVKSMHVEGNFPCEACKKVFTSSQKLKNHVDAVHKMYKRFKCPKCPERFTEYFRRQKHMVVTHGMAPLQYKCNVCDKSFDRRYTLSRHMKRDHLEERDFQCESCTYKCFTKNELRVHMIKHNGERIFECLVCKKSYARKKTLKEHMKIHNNDRRFACSVCGQAFVQNCSLKGHMKSHHAEYNLQ